MLEFLEPVAVVIGFVILIPLLVFIGLVVLVSAVLASYYLVSWSRRASLRRATNKAMWRDIEAMEVPELDSIEGLDTSAGNEEDQMDDLRELLGEFGEKAPN